MSISCTQDECNYGEIGTVEGKGISEEKEKEEFCHQDFYFDDYPERQSFFGGERTENQPKLRDNVCKFFNSISGCKRGHNCSFKHIKLKFCWWQTYSKCVFHNLCWNPHKKEETTHKIKESNKRKRIKMNLKLEIKKLTEKIKWLKRQVDTIRQRKLSQSQELQKANEGMGENEVQITGRTSNGIIPVKCKKTYDLLSQSQRLPKANERMDENEVQITSRTSNGMIPVKCKKTYDLLSQSQRLPKANEIREHYLSYLKL